MTWVTTPFVRAGIELDRICLEGIQATGYHGVFESERREGQPFIADVVAHVSTRAAAARDDLAMTVDYADMAARVQAVLAGEPVNLIETLAERAALAVLDMDGVFCVDVRIHKPQAPVGVPFGDVTVAVRRDLRTGGLWADKRIGSSAGLPDDPLDFSGSAPVRDLFDRRPLRPVQAIIALGANLGDAPQTLVQAAHALHRINGVQVLACSSLYRSAPMGGPAQPDYFNAALRVLTALSPRELLGAAQGLEIVHHRERKELNGPRTLDVDIVDYDGVAGAASDLVLPHPRAHERPFVLVPWAEVDAAGVLVGYGPIAQQAAAMAPAVQVVARPWPSPPLPELALYAEPSGADGEPVSTGDTIQIGPMPTQLTEQGGQP